MSKLSQVSGSRGRWLVLAVALAPLLASPARAEETAPAAPVAAAWHPMGVGAVTAATYPEGTLHVGAALGTETDRTYLRFEMPSLPDDADAGDVMVSIAADAEAGTSSPETAVVLGCAVPGGFDPEAAEPAEVDCEGAPEATFADGTFILTLEAPAGDSIDVALVPGGGDTWHVGFAEDGVDARVSYDVPAASTTSTTRAQASPPPTYAAPGTGTPLAIPPITLPPPAAVGGAIDEAASAAPVVSPTVAAPTASGGGFRYAAVFALPLVLLVLVALIGDGLTRPVRLREETA